MRDKYTDERRITNNSGKPVEVWFEPWGMPLEFEINDVIKVKAVSYIPGSMEVVYEDDLIAVYGWSGCSMTVFRGEELILDLFELPDLDDGPSPRTVVELLFGGPGGPK